MKVTRQHMIDAVMTEPLAKGWWVHKTDEELMFSDINPLNIKFDEDNCPVCAVGGTLRKVGLDNYGIMTECSSLMPNTPPATAWIKGYIDDGRFLEALSCFFEDGEWKTREDLKEWVEENVPEDWELELRNNSV